MLNKIFTWLLIISSVSYGVKHSDDFLWSSKQVSISDRSYTKKHYEYQNPEAPENFKVESIGHNWSILSWEAPKVANNNYNYHIYRNKVLVANLSSKQFVYKDTLLRQNQAYEYEIFASNLEGWASHKIKVNLKTRKNTAPNISKNKKRVSISHLVSVGTHIYTVIAKDKNNDELYYTIKGEDSDKFMINNETGKIINREHLQAHKIYQINVEVSDGMSKNALLFKIRT